MHHFMLGSCIDWSLAALGVVLFEVNVIVTVTAAPGVEKGAAK